MEQHRSGGRLGDDRQHLGDRRLPAAQRQRVEVEQQILAGCGNGCQAVEQRDVVIVHGRVGAERVGLGGQFVGTTQVDDGGHALGNQRLHARIVEPVQAIGPQDAAPARLAVSGGIAAQIADIVGAFDRQMAVELVQHQRIPDFMKDWTTWRCRTM